MLLKSLPYKILILLLLLSSSVHAATVTHDIVTKIAPGHPLATNPRYATSVGSISYDDSLISGVGIEYLDISSSLTLEFLLFGEHDQRFTEADAHLPGQPSLKFVDGVMTYLDFSVSEPDTYIRLLSVYGFNFDDASGVNIRPISGGYEMNVNIVPVPAAVWLFVTGLIGLFGLARKSKL